MLYLITHSDLLDFYEQNLNKVKYRLNLLYDYNFKSFSTVTFPIDIIENYEKGPYEFIIIDIIPPNYHEYKDNISKYLNYFLELFEKNFIFDINKPLIFIHVPNDIDIEFSRILSVSARYFHSRSELIEDFKRRLGRYHDLEYFIFNRLPILYNNEAFYYMVLFRRKWLIKIFPDREEEFRKYFNSDEMKIVNGILKGNIDNFTGILSHAWQVIYSQKYKVYKERYYNIGRLYDKFQFGFSFLITFEPRNIERAFKKYIIDMTKLMLNKDISSISHIIMHCDKELSRYIHQERRASSPKYVLVDCDFNNKYLIEKMGHISALQRMKFIDEVRLNFINEVKKYFNEVGVLDNLAYSCSTPSFGMHIIFEIDDKIGEKIFKEREKFTKTLHMIGHETNYLFEDIEIKTGQCLTHIPGFNFFVKDLTDSFKK